MRPPCSDAGSCRDTRPPRSPGEVPRVFSCYHRPMTEALQDELERLKQRREDLKAAITARKREVARLQIKRSQALEDQLRRVRSRLSSSERKLRTRRLIVLGSLMEKEHSPADLLDKLDHALDRHQDRALFGLPPKGAADGDRSAPTAPAPLQGWRPTRLPDGSWGCLYTGRNATALPDKLVGLTISVRTRSGASWDTTVTEVVERSPDRVLVRDHKLDR